MTLDADNMAEVIEQAFQSEWNAVKGVPLPATGERDRMILFVAVARGILQYLKAHEADLITTIDFDTAGGHSHTLTLNDG